MKLTPRTLLVRNGALIVVLLLALALRMYHIDAQSLWNDEGTSVALAARDLAGITHSAANDIHPPLYYYLLHYWTAAFGFSERAVRGLSALLGTLVVLLTFAWSSRVEEATRTQAPHGVVGLLAALIAALSPFQAYYSQETRMYILATFLGLLSTLGLLQLLATWEREADSSGQSARPSHPFVLIISYIVVTTMLLYTHYFTVTLVVVQNLAFLWWLIERRRSATPAASVLRWAALQLIIALAYVPWLLLARQPLLSWPAISEPLRPASMALDVLRTFSLGVASESASPLVLSGFAALLVLGAVSLRPGRADQPQLSNGGSLAYVSALLYLFAPIGMMYLLSLRRPMHDPKFLLLSTPPFHLFLAQGTLVLGSGVRKLTAHGEGRPKIGRWLAAVLTLMAVAFIAASSFDSLRGYYFDPRHARDDYRAIARYVQAVEQEGDAVLINAPGQIETFTYYYRGSLQLYALPRQRPLNRGETELDLQEMVQGRRHIFAVLWATDESDPERFIEGWLDQQTYKAMDSWYGNVRLVVYAVPSHAGSGQIEHPLDVNLGNQVQLLGYNLPTTRVTPGDIVQLTLFWEALTPMSERYKVFTHLLDGNGHLVGQRDAEPGGGAKITTTWQKGEPITDNYGLPVLPATPPGEYYLEIGMYSLSEGTRLPVVEGGHAVADHIILQSVHVVPAAVPPPVSVLGMHRELNTRFADVTLLGHSLAKLGFEHQPEALLQAGDILHLTLFWRANAKPNESVVLQLQLRDGKGEARLEWRKEPTEGLYPITVWSPGEVVRDQHNLPLPGDLPAGRYRLDLSVLPAIDGQQIGSAVSLTTLVVGD